MKPDLKLVVKDGARLSCGVVADPVSVANIWDQVHPLLVRAMEKSEGEQTEEEIAKCILSGKFQLWVGMEEETVVAMWTTTLQRYEGKTICYANYAAAEVGYLDALLRWFDQACEWAKDRGCDQMQVIGRKGWQKKLNWRANQILYVKDLT